MQKFYKIKIKFTKSKILLKFFALVRIRSLDRAVPSGKIELLIFLTQLKNK
jgi:hypothetical protein